MAGRVGGEPGGLPHRADPAGPLPRGHRVLRRPAPGRRRAAGRPSPGAGDGLGVQLAPARRAQPAPPGRARAGDVVGQGGLDPARAGRCSRRSAGAGRSGAAAPARLAAGRRAAVGRDRRRCRRRRRGIRAAPARHGRGDALDGRSRSRTGRRIGHRARTRDSSRRDRRPASKLRLMKSSPDTRQGPPRDGVALVERMSGGVLLSHAVPRAVPSALKGLASGFGMEPGVSPSL